MASVHRLLAARGLRAFGDGFTALLLPVQLAALGFSDFRIGLIAGLSLAGSAVLTLGVGLAGHRVSARRLLWASGLVMAATGFAFAVAHGFWALAVVAVMGTLNPSGGDVSVFVPLEQAMLAHAPAARRTHLFALYSLGGALCTAAGSLVVTGLDLFGRAAGLGRAEVAALAFAGYGLLGLAIFGLYLGLPEARAEDAPPAAPLGPSRPRVLQLAALFSVDSFAGGLMMKGMMALWLFHRFGMSVGLAGAFFFWSGLLTAFSQLAASWLARRVGLVNTMVWTHIPASLCVIAAAFAPNLPLALGLLTVRAALQAMDVPARNSYVMAVVTPPERAAAAGVTNVPRSLAAAASPALAGLMYGTAGLAWPLVIGGVLKIGYDLALLAMFRKVKPPEES